MRFLMLLLVGAALVPGDASAQFAADQPTSLKGVGTVFVNFVEPNQRMDAALRADMFDAAILELRKSGLRVVREPSDTQQADALLNLSVRIITGLTDFVEVRMDVEQKVSVVRTGDQLQLVTWYYEASSNESSWRSSAKPMALKATNKFISDWLDANNR